MPKLGMKELRKEQVITAAKNRIVRNGLSNLSLKNIAEEAGVSTGIIYHYFDNKEDVLLQVLKESFRQSHLKVMETVEPLPTAKEKLPKHLENINAVPKENPEFYLILMDYLGEANHNKKIREIISRFFSNLKSYIEEYLGEGRQEDLGNLPVMIYALGLGLGLMWTIDEDLYDIDRMEKDFKRLVMGYLEKGG